MVMDSVLSYVVNIKLSLISHILIAERMLVIFMLLMIGCNYDQSYLHEVNDLG